MSAFHDPGDTRDLDDRDDYARLRDEEWLDYLRSRELDRQDRLFEHRPLGAKPVSAGSAFSRRGAAVPPELAPEEPKAAA